jgi:hypothetical protein
MGATDEVGVDLYSPPVVGGSYPDYWRNDGGTWSLQTGSVPVDFAARIEATPEPSAVVLSIFGGLGALAVRRWLSRKA